MKRKIIGIIGNKGHFGRKLKEFCVGEGFTVIGSDLNTALSNREVVEKSDVVIFSVPPRFTAPVIEEVLPFSRPEQLWLDVTSVKVLPIEAMRRSKSEVVGLHPMSAPSVNSFEGQVIVKCVERLDKWRVWLDGFLLLTKANIVERPPHTHDVYGAVIQALLHDVLIAMMGMLGSIRSHQFDPKLLLGQASPLFYLQLVLMGRVLSRDAGLYADIQLYNPYTLPALRSFEAHIKMLRRKIERRDTEGFMAVFKNVKSFFGEDDLQEFSDVFEEVVKIIASKRSKTTSSSLHKQGG